jgi:ABC-2 type transport system ATP-binding protein
VVEIEHLSKTYTPRRRGGVPQVALSDVSLSIREAEIFALLGPNGAGKTTLIGCVCGLVTPGGGRARVGGHDVVADYRASRRLVGLVPQEINFDPFFSVEESLRFQAGYFGVRLDPARLDEILVTLGLREKRRANTRTLSGGMKRRLLIAKALVHRPRVLFLDEPTAGVDVALRRDLWAYVRRLRDEGTTIVLTTHYLEEAEQLADRIGLIDHGKLLLVEEKTALLHRLGQRTVRIAVDAGSSVPPELAARGAVAVASDAIEITLGTHEQLGPVLATALSAGLAVRDVETRRTDLEEVYVRLLEKSP